MPNPMPAFVIDRQPSPRFWIAVFTFCVASSWLIPNIYEPWPSFHKEIWLALLGLMAFAYCVLNRTDQPWQWPPTALFLAGLSLIPLIQYAFGLLSFRGPALLSSAYLLAFAISVALGARSYALWGWRWMHLLMQAILLAAVLTAFIIAAQRYQLISSDRYSWWSMLLIPSYSMRPGGNLGQANLAATLMFWGLLGAYWRLAIICKSTARRAAFVLLACVLILGIAFTQSRAAWLSSFLLACILTVRLAILRKNKQEPNFVEPASLHIFQEARAMSRDAWLFFAALSLLTWLIIYAPQSNMFASAVPSAITEAVIPQHSVRIDSDIKTNNLRAIVYPEFFKASLRSPWWGYGTQQVGIIQADFDLPGREIDGFHMQSHSIFLDLLLWFGWPVGLGVFLAMLGWMARHAWRSRFSSDCAVLFGIVLVMLVHSMVEWPHMMLNMLLPIGFIAGAVLKYNDRTNFAEAANISQAHGCRWQWQTGRVPAFVALGLLLGFTVLLIKEYAVLEREYTLLRFEALKIGPRGLDQIENLYLLDHWQAHLEAARVKPGNKSPEELHRADQAVEALPAMRTMYTLAASYAVSGDESRSLLWMRRVNSVASKAAALEFAKKWEVWRISERVTTKPWPQTGVLADLPAR